MVVRRWKEEQELNILKSGIEESDKAKFRRTKYTYRFQFKSFRKVGRERMTSDERQKKTRAGD
jgi:hypothetical protein